jgi:hypothetical protein
LIDQLKACAVKLGEQAEVLQSLIHKGRNKNKHYKAVTDEVLRHEKNEVLSHRMVFKFDNT